MRNGQNDESFSEVFDNLSVWAFQAGFGGEYFFSESFSLGGEFGVRIILTSYEEEESQTHTMWDGTTYTTTSKYKLDLGLGITYSSLCLNFYF